MSQINMRLNITTNKKSLDDLSKSLDGIIAKANQFEKAMGSDSGYELPYHEAAVAAQELKNVLTSSWNSKVNQLDLTKVRNEIIKSYGSLNTFKDTLLQIGPEGQVACQQLSSAIFHMQAPIKQTSKLVEQMSITMGNTIRFGISSAIFNKVKGSLSESYNYIKKLDKSLNDIRVVSYETADNMERFAKQANTAAKNLGTSTLDYTNAALIYYQQGLTGADVTERVDTTLKLANTTGESASDVSDYMTAIWNNFKDGSKTVEYYADVLAKLGAETASSSDEIAAGLEKFASVAETVGLSYEYATSALTTITATTRQSADVVGTALKTLFSRIQDLELGDTLDDGTTLGTYSEALEKVGINIKNQNGELKKMDDILDEMGSKWGTLNNAQQVALAQSVAGVRQYNQLMALMNNWDEMKINISRAESAEGTLDKQQEIYMESLDAHLEKLGASWESLYDNLLDEDLIKGFADLFAGLINGVNTIVTGLGGGFNNLIFVVSSLSNLLSSKLAESLVRVKDNSEAAAKATKNLAIQQEFLQAFTTTRALELNQENAKAYAQELAITQKLIAYKGQMSQEEQKYLGVLDDELTKLQEEKRIYTLLASHRKDSDGMVSKEEAEKNKWNKQDVHYIASSRAKKMDRSFGSDNERNAAYANDYKQRIQKNVEKLNQNKDLLNGFNLEALSNEDFTITDEGLKRLINTSQNLQKNIDQLWTTKKEITSKNGQLTVQEEQIVKGIEDQIKKLGREKAEVRKVVDARGNLAFIEKNEIVNALQDENSWLRKNNKTYGNILEIIRKYPNISKEELQQRVLIKATEEERILKEKESLALKQQEEQALQGLIQIGSTLTSSVTSIIGIFKTIANPDLSGWEKLSSILSVLATQSFQLFRTFKDFGQTSADIVNYLVNKQLTKELEKQTAIKLANSAADNTRAVSISKVTIAQINELGTSKLSYAAKVKELIANGTLSASNMSLGATFAFVGSSALAAMAPLLPYIAAIGAIGAAVAYLIWKSKEQERQMERLKEVQEEMNEKASTLKTTIEDLNSSFEDLKEAENTLSSCIKYSSEWYSQLDLVNQKINEILTAYPDLMNIEGIIKRDSETGLLSFNLDKVSEYLENKNSQLDLSTWAAKLNELKTAELERDQIWDEGKIIKIINPSYTTTESETPYAQLSREERAKRDNKNYQTFDRKGQLPPTFTLQLSEADQKLLGSQGSSENYLKALQEMASRYVDKYSQYGLSEETFINTFKDGQETFNNIYEQAVSIDTKIGNLKTVIVPQDIAAEGEYATQLWEENVDPTKIEEDIRSTEKKGVAKIDGKGDADAITFMRNYIESQGGVWEASKFTDVTGDDDHRKYKYDGEILDADVMAEEIAAAIVTNGYQIKNYGLTGENGIWANLTEKTQIKDQEEIIKKAQEDTQKISNQLGVDQELAKKIAAGSLDNLTTEDLDILQGLDTEELNTIFEMLGKGSAEKFIEGFNSYDKSLAEENLKKEIESIYQNGAAATGETVAGLKDIAFMFKQTREGAKLSEKELAKYAVSAAKFSKNMDALKDTVDDNSDALEEWVKAGDDYESMSREARLASQKLQTSIKDVFGVDVPIQTLQDNFDTIKKAIKGDKDALIEFQKILASDQLDDIDLKWNADLSEEEKQGLVQNFNMQVDDIIDQTKDLEIGAKFDDAEALESMNAFVAASGMSAQQVQNYFDKIGYDAEVETKTVPQTTKHSIGIPFAKTINSALGMQLPESIDWTTTSDITVPVIKSLKKSNNFVNYKPSSTKSGSSGSSKSKNTSTDKVDRYQEVNNQLAETSAELEKIQSQTDKLTGPELVQNLNKQIQNLNKNLELTEKKIRIAKNEQQEYADALKNTYGVVFNSDGSINQDSYVAAFQREQSRYTSAYSDDDAAKERWENFKEYISQFNSLDTTIQGLIQEKIDNANTIIEKKIAAFRVSFDISLDLTEARQQWVEFKKDVIDELADEDLLGTLKSYGESLKTYFRGDTTGAVQQDKKRLEDLMKIYDKFQNGDTSTIYGDNESQLLEDIQEAQEQLQSDLTDWESLIDDIQAMYLKGLEQAADAFSDAIEDMSAITQIIDHQIKLMEYALGNKAYKEQTKAYTEKVKSIQAQIDFQTKENEFWKKQLEITEERLRSVQDTDSEEYRSVLEEYNKAKEEFENSTNELLSSYEEKMDALTSAYVANMEAVFAAYNENLAGMSLDEANSEWDLLNKESEEYLDTINAIYGVQSIANKYTESINDQSIAAQQKLSKIMESELEMLRSKDKLSQYDLDRADLRYQIALKQIALEEAQQNKTTLRLRRDSQGNYTYQYTQDEDEITKLQNELSDLYNQLYNLDTEKYSGNLEKVYELTAEYQDKYKEILQDAGLVEEERQQKILALTETYGDLINSLTEQNEEIKANLKESSMAEVFDLYNKDEDNYRMLNENQKAILSQYLDDEVDLTNSAYNSIFDIYDEAVEKTKAMTSEQIDTLMTSFIPEWVSAYQTVVDNLNAEGGFKESMLAIQDSLLDAAEQYFKVVRDGYAESDNIAESHQDIVSDIVAEYDDLTATYEDLLAKMLDSEATLNKFVATWKGAADNAKDLLDTTNSTIDAMKALKLIESGEEEKKIEETTTPDTSSSTTTPDTSSTNSNPYSGYRLGGQSYTIRSGDTLWAIARSKYGDSSLWREIWNNNRNNLRSGNPNLIYPGEVIKLDTGGYTGEWNSNDGKMAMLHQKELVLNADDTKNILAAVAMLRNMTAANLSQIGANIGIGGNGVEQNVHIDATFPNVTNSNEIQDAFNNLINIAAQRINR